MKRWFGRSLKNQLLVLILVTVFIPVFFLGLISYFITIDVSKDRAEISGSSSVNQLQTSLDFIIDDILSMSIFLIGNRDVQDYLSEDESTPMQRSNINGFLANLVYSKDYMANITLYPSSENEILSTSSQPIVKEDFSKYTENKWWTYRNLEKKSDGTHGTITLTRPVRDLSHFDIVGYLSISINQEFMMDLLHSIDLEWSGHLLLIQDGNILASNRDWRDNEFDLGQLTSNSNSADEINFATKYVNGNKSTVFSTKIADVDWDLISIIPYKEYSSQNTYLLILMICTILIGTLLAIFLIIFVISKVLDPLVKLTESLKHAEPGERIKQHSFSGKDEISRLVNSYNELNDRVKVLMDKVKVNESIKRQVDLAALQNQINPHFLYNTLASVHWMALSSGAKEISAMVSSLSTYLRHSLNAGDEYCTVEQEIAHLIHYSKIQAIRFPEKFKIDAVISENAKQHMILKLILQPLIENSIIHGNSPNMDTKTRIQIYIEKVAGRLYFKVSDDGVGMTRKQIVHFKNQFKEDGQAKIVVGDNYGLRNVNLRLVMHYGKDAQLDITSEKNKGVCVQFSIPVDEEDW